jgi:hypothetical protein
MTHTKDEALKLAKSWFEANTYGDEAVEVYEAIEQALAAPVPDIEYCADYHCAGDCGKPHNQKEMQDFLKAQPAPVTAFDDPLVQTVYNILCDADEGKPREEHWEGWKARRIVAALTTPQTQPAPVQEPADMDSFLPKLNELYGKITPPPYFAAADNRGIGLAGGRWTKNGAFQDVTNASVARHGGTDGDNIRFIVAVVNAWEKISAILATPPAAQPAPVQEQFRDATKMIVAGNKMASIINTAITAPVNEWPTTYELDVVIKEWKQATTEDFAVVPPAAQPAPCTWTKSNDPHMPDTFDATCGVVWTFTDGGPAENDVRFCPGCGGKVVKGKP